MRTPTQDPTARPLTRPRRAVGGDPAAELAAGPHIGRHLPGYRRGDRARLDPRVTGAGMSEAEQSSICARSHRRGAGRAYTSSMLRVVRGSRIDEYDVGYV
jgi:hypothetical protein